MDDTPTLKFRSGQSSVESVHGPCCRPLDKPRESQPERWQAIHESDRPAALETLCKRHTFSWDLDKSAIQFTSALNGTRSTRRANGLHPAATPAGRLHPRAGAGCVDREDPGPSASGAAGVVDVGLQARHHNTVRLPASPLRSRRTLVVQRCRHPDFRRLAGDGADHQPIATSPSVSPEPNAVTTRPSSGDAVGRASVLPVDQDEPAAGRQHVPRTEVEVGDQLVRRSFRSSLAWSFLRCPRLGLLIHRPGVTPSKVLTARVCDDGHSQQGDQPGEHPPRQRRSSCPAARR